MEVWQQILAAVGVGLAALVAALLAGARGVLVKWLQRVERRVGRDTVLEALEWVSVVRRAYHEFRTLSFVDRVLLLVTIDYAVDGRVCYVRAFDGWGLVGKPDPVDLYSHRIRADAAYLTMLAELVRDGVSVQTVQTMPAGSVLRRYYEAEGVVQSLLYLLRDFGDGKVMYISVASYTREFSPVETTSISITVDQIRSTLLGDAT